MLVHSEYYVLVAALRFAVVEAPLQFVPGWFEGLLELYSAVEVDAVENFIGYWMPYVGFL